MAGCATPSTGSGSGGLSSGAGAVSSSTPNVIGLLTEPEPELLGERQHAIFRNLTYRSGAIRPKRADTGIVAPDYPYDQLGTNAVAEIVLPGDASRWYAQCAYAGSGGITLNNGSGTTEALAMAPPAGPPTSAVLANNATGLADGETRTYCAAWASTTGDGTYHTSPGTTATATASGATQKVTWSQPAGTPPTGTEQWVLYVLENATGVWRKIGQANLAATIVDDDNVGSLGDLDPYDAPLDANGDPEVLIVPDTCRDVITHKGCLMAASGDYVRWSDATEPRWFRQRSYVDAGAPVLRIVSWMETVFAFTGTGIYEVVGNPPYFEIRTVHNCPGIRAILSLWPSKVGIFYLSKDGLELFNGQNVKSLTNGINTPWIDAIAAPAASVAGAHGYAYVLVDSTATAESDYRGLRFDWEKQEFSETRFGVFPAQFRWDGTNHRLVYKSASNYYEWEGAAATTNVDWRMRYRTVRSTCTWKVPAAIIADALGDANWDLRVDDALVASGTFQPTYRLRFPKVRGREWDLELHGTGANSTSIIRSLRIKSE